MVDHYGSSWKKVRIQNPGGPDARTGPHEREDQGAAAEDGGAADAADAAGAAADPTETALVARDAGPEDGGDGGGAELVVRDAGADAGDAGKRKVDREEHRKGMPVRDNLLE
jgi:hypothetical protein